VVVGVSRAQRGGGRRGDGPDVDVLADLLAASVRIGTPLLFAALGGILSERAGVFAVGLEGMMLAGAFAGVIATQMLGHLGAGLFASALGGAALAVTVVLAPQRHGAEQMVPGLAVTSCELFRVIRNANTERDEDQADDLLELIEAELRDRRFAPIVRLEIEPGMDVTRRGMLVAELLRESGDAEAAIATFARVGESDPAPALGARAFEQALAMDQALGIAHGFAGYNAALLVRAG